MTPGTFRCYQHSTAEALSAHPCSSLGFSLTALDSTPRATFAPHSIYICIYRYICICKVRSTLLYIVLSVQYPIKRPRTPFPPLSASVRHLNLHLSGYLDHVASKAEQTRCQTLSSALFFPSPASGVGVHRSLQCLRHMHHLHLSGHLNLLERYTATTELLL